MVIRIALCLSILFLATTGNGQTKRALLVAIGEYDDFRSWRKISSVEDLPYIKAGLHQFGFEDSNIDTIKNEKATKANMLAALDALAQRSAPGDIVVFFFCGHGQQVMDNNGTPDEFDGYDEALVPYEAPGQYDPVNNTGQLHLRDDELYPKLKAIHDRIGKDGNLLVMIDACHSGTATRADAFMVTRGSARPLAPEDYVPDIKLDIGNAAAFSDNGQLERMVTISASGPDQLNYQTLDDKGKGVGVLSYAFAKACFELKPGDNYELMFEKIKARIQSNKPTQVPIIEGNTKLQVFSGKFSDAGDIIGINESQWRNDSSFVINRGYLHDLTAGSRFHLTRLGSSEVVARGYVARVEAIQSFGVVVPAPDRKEGYALTLDEVVPDDMQARLFVSNKGKDLKKGEKWKGEVERRIKAYPWITLSDPADMMLEVKGDSVSLVDNGGRVLYRDLAGESLTDEKWKEILGRVNADTRIRYLRNLPDGGSLAAGIRGKVVSTSRAMDSSRNEFVFEANDQFVISLENKGEKKLYFNLINITPGNEISLLLPAAGLTAAQCQILPRNTYRTPALRISPGTPSGKEVFKVILSEQPFDLGPVVKRLKGNTQRAGMGQLEKLFDDMYDDEGARLQTKRDMSKVEIDKMGVVTIGYTVK